MRIAVITVSDRAWRGEYKDKSGPAIAETIKALLPDSTFETELVPDEGGLISTALEHHSQADWIITTGGTGIGPRDVTPEATEAYCERELPGLSEYLRRQSLEETPFAVFSRAYAGVKGRQIVVNFPGSEKAARFCAHLIAPLLKHSIAMLNGEGH